MSERVLPDFSRLWRICVLLLLSVSWLAGCSSSMTLVKTYDGDTLPAARQAVLQAPANIKVLSVNGRDVTSFLLDDIAISYGLMPGEQEVVFQYRSIWAKSGKIESDGKRVDVVESPRHVVRFVAQPEGTYTFRYPQPDSRAQAEAVARALKVSLVDGQSKALAVASPWQPATSAQASGVVAPLAVGTGTTGAHAPVASAQGPVGGASLQPGLPVLDGLMLLWDQATPEEKREFMRRAFK